MHMSKTDVSKVLGVTRATVYKMIEDGRLTDNVAGKVPTESVIRMITGPSGRKYNV